ncbi:MAG: hypothetical protein WDM89_07555 [Rhizomicrobium sp.]
MELKPGASSVADFCKLNGIGRATFYKLIGAGRGPRTMKVGSRTLISDEAAEEWRRRMEAETEAAA